jgi:hypothetical protein
MSPPLVVRPDRYRQFGTGNRPFYLVTDTSLVDAFTMAGQGTVLGADPAAGVAGMLADRTEPTADVLIAAPGSFLGPLDTAALAERRIVALPCGSTPVTLEQIAAVLPVMEQTDPAAQAARAAEFFESVEGCQSITITDRARGTTSALRPHDGDGEWHQQAGPVDDGELQIAPAGELSVLAGGISAFDADSAMALSGDLTLRGPVIVHAGYDPGLAAEQERCYRSLAGVYHGPVVLGTDSGVVVDCRPGDGSAGARQAATALRDLLDSDQNYRTVWEIGFGINTELGILPGNCGFNEVFGGQHGVLHIGLGLTPATRFALTFLCPDSSVTTNQGRRLAGSASRITRTRSASCGCHQPAADPQF